MKFSQKNFENWRFWKMHFFWVGHFDFFFQKKNFFCLILTKARNFRKKKYWEVVELENNVFWVGHFDFFFQKKMFISMKINFVFHMRYHLFLHYGWFLQNLVKDFIRTIMHTTVTFLRLWSDSPIYP